jgi:hypothetical protein
MEVVHQTDYHLVVQLPLIGNRFTPVHKYYRDKLILILLV